MLIQWDNGILSRDVNHNSTSQLLVEVTTSSSARCSYGSNTIYCFYFLCLIYFLFCFTHKHKLCCYDHGNHLVLDLSSNWVDVNFKCFVITDSNYAFSHTDVLTCLHTCYICLSLPGADVCSNIAVVRCGRCAPIFVLTLSPATLQMNYSTNP